MLHAVNFASNSIECIVAKKAMCACVYISFFAGTV